MIFLVKDSSTSSISFNLNFILQKLFRIKCLENNFGSDIREYSFIHGNRLFIDCCFINVSCF